MYTCLVKTLIRSPFPLTSVSGGVSQILFVFFFLSRRLCLLGDMPPIANFTHYYRCTRFRKRGVLDRTEALRRMVKGAARSTGTGGSMQASSEEPMEHLLVRQCIESGMVCDAHCGMHMIDSYGHVNNAKYLELFEYGRWYANAFAGWGRYLASHQIHARVHNFSIQYIREIKPFADVKVSQQLTAMYADARNADVSCLNSIQGIWNADGSKIHSSAIAQIGFVGPASTAEALLRQFGGDEQTSEAPPAGRQQLVPLDAVCVLAAASELPIEQVRALLLHSRASVAAAAAGQRKERSCGDSEDWLAHLNHATGQWLGTSK
ncbi:hypothetical protein STCU_02335 [Strigomonas culicis]|uniref:Acyl-CoA thioester hydrolase n=1 Tax=Strigomonas culicis TaxID=28005 RepID=S9UWN8_9TRYP|nr:hypothetical protein STCU_02335 [Strigomonas culicis]|eukprot:EPY33293.1 hypothetical protein STCU_02335 [Strigomonas culicis]